MTRGVSALEELSPSAWDELLATVDLDDVYFASAYLRSASLLGQGHPRFLRLESRQGAVVFPCLVREAGDGLSDVATPMGYGGPVATGVDPPVGEFFGRYDEWCAANGVVATFARFHPLLENHRLAHRAWHVERIGRSVGWRVEGRSAEALFEGMESHHRRLARRALGAGVVATAASSAHELDRFVPLYEENMRRRGASSFYVFPSEYWEWLATRLRRRLVRFDAERDGVLVASILCLGGGRFLHYHLGCSSEEARALGANHLLFHHAAAWAAGRGYVRFHLGGGVGGFEDSLYEFKRRFDGGGSVPACLGKAIHDVDAYRRLTGGSKIEYAGYFPAYRRSLG